VSENFEVSPVLKVESDPNLHYCIDQFLLLVVLSDATNALCALDYESESSIRELWLQKIFTTGWTSSQC
jgi:hypothetical protein